MFKVGDAVLIHGWDIGAYYWDGPAIVVEVRKHDIVIETSRNKIISAGQQGAFETKYLAPYARHAIRKTCIWSKR